MSSPKVPDDKNTADETVPKKPEPKPMPREIGGPKGPEPTRYGDWERKGIATDF